MRPDRGQLAASSGVLPVTTEQKVINPFALKCCDVSGHRARVSRDIVHVGLGLVVAGRVSGRVVVVGVARRR
jgi:hypothetical protein